MITYRYPPLPTVSLSAGPVEFLLDGVSTPVSLDTVTPANSNPLPVTLAAGGTFNNDYGASAGALRTASQIGNTTGAANFNYGAVGAQTLRTAAQVGNATGAADFGSGVVGAQTLRTALASDQLATLATETTLAALNTKVNSNYGAATGAVRTAAQVGNATGAADFGSGVVGAQTLRTALASDQLSTLATETTLSDLNAKVANNYGAATGAVRTAAQVGNATGAADFNAGATGAQTQRVSANILRDGNALDYDSGASSANTLRSVLATRHEAAATPLSFRPSTGAAFITSAAIAAAQFTTSTVAALFHQISFMVGWDGTTHRELAVTTTGAMKVASGTGAAQADGGSVSNSTVSTTAATVTAPANAIGFILSAYQTNTGNIFWAIGATATNNGTSGQYIEASRDTGFIPCGANISVIADTATQGYNIQWFTRS